MFYSGLLMITITIKANKNNAVNFPASLFDLASGNCKVTNLNQKPVSKAVIFVLSGKYR